MLKGIFFYDGVKRHAHFNHLMQPEIPFVLTAPERPTQWVPGLWAHLKSHKVAHENSGTLTRKAYDLDHWNDVLRKLRPFEASWTIPEVAAPEPSLILLEKWAPSLLLFGSTSLSSQRPGNTFIQVTCKQKAVFLMPCHRHSVSRLLIRTRSWHAPEGPRANVAAGGASWQIP